FSPTLPDSPISAVRASPGMTRMRPKTISEDRISTGTASSSRRSMYLYTQRSPRALIGPGVGRPRLLVQPEACERRRPVTVVAPHGERADVAEVRLPDEEAIVVGHPHPQDLIELALRHLLGDRALLGAVWRLPELGDELVDHGVGEPEVV